MKATLYGMALFVWLGHLAAADAQSYSINWYRIPGGGGSSTGQIYQVNGSIGQYEAGRPLTGGAYSLTGGFWSLYAVQTAGAPTLYISQAGGTAVISWENVSGWNLFQNPDLALPNGWIACSGVSTLNGTNYLNLTAPMGKMFFRLKHP